jgi:hypothetical protein
MVDESLKKICLSLRQRRLTNAQQITRKAMFTNTTPKTLENI